MEELIKKIEYAHIELYNEKGGDWIITLDFDEKTIGKQFYGKTIEDAIQRALSFQDKTAKYADKDCEICEGFGDIEEFEKTITCECVKRNKAEQAGEDQFELSRGN